MSICIYIIIYSTKNQVTMEMMGCMREHEYYDIMTAGTEGRYESAKEAIKAAEEIESNPLPPPTL
jgi:hypothetical protein